MCKGNHKFSIKTLQIQILQLISNPACWLSVMDKATTTPRQCYSLGRHFLFIYLFILLLGKERKPSKLDSRI